MVEWLRNLFALARPDSESRRSVADEALLDYLEAQIPAEDDSKAGRRELEKYRARSERDRIEHLPELYLFLEQHLVQSDASTGLSRRLLRHRIRDRFPDLVDRPELRLIFESPAEQEVLLARRFLLSVIGSADAILGATEGELLSELQDWLRELPETGRPPRSIEVEHEEPENPRQWVDCLTEISHELFDRLHDKIGEAAERMFRSSYRELSERYGGLETFPIVVRMLPPTLLDSKMLQLLSYGQEESKLAAVQEELAAASHELSRTRKELQAVLDTAGEAIVTVDEGGVAVLANRELERLWNVTPEALTGESIESLFALSPDTDRSSEEQPGSWFVQEVLVDALNEARELTGIRPDGSTFPVELQANRTQIGNRRFVTCSMRDVTDRKEYEQALITAKEEAEEMNRLKSVFLANMSHEIRTPLTSILGFAEILADEAGEEYADYAELIHSSGQRLMRTLNAVLDFSQLEAGAMTVNLEPVDLVEHVRETVDLLRPRAEDKNLELRFTHPEPNYEIITDPTLLERILDNLIDNALKFTNRGRVTVEIVDRGAHFDIRVEDTGIGMKSEFENLLFEQFRQESSGLRRTHEGVGLGLAITDRVTKLLNGSIEVDSTRGEGTTFTLAFPRKLDPDEIEAEASVRIDRRE